MEIYFNELSILPNSTSIDASRNKVVELIKVMKQLHQHNILMLRTYEGFYAEDLGCNYTFSSFLTDENVSIDLKILLQSITSNPCIPDLESIEANEYINTKFETQNYNAEWVAPEGIAVSYINSVPTLSLIDYPQWQRATLPLKVFSNESENYSLENVINISSIQSLKNTELLEWIKSITVAINLNSYDNIIKQFPLDKYQFDNKAIDDIISWYYDDKRFLLRIKDLIDDISKNPFTGGKGKTETLSGTGGRASKRIIKKDRIIYTYTENKIFIHQCRGHYNNN